MTHSNFPRARTTLLAGAIALLFIAPFVVPLQAGSTPSAPREPKIQIVGTSILLRMQREGAPVFDFRSDGQNIPGAQKTQEKSFNQNDFSSATSLVLIGDETRMTALAQSLQKRKNAPQIYIVPQSKVAAYPDFAGVQQIEPRAFFQKQNAARKIPIFDFAEDEEFSFARVAGSTRVPWSQFISGDRSFLQNKNGGKIKTIALICPVGSRSQIAAQKLKREGVRVINIRGGMFAWQNAGLPIVGEMQNAFGSTPNAN